MSQVNLTLRDVRDSINSGHFKRTASAYASQRFHALNEWAGNHKAEIGLALIITGVAIAVLCGGVSIFAFILSEKIGSLAFLTFDSGLSSSLLSLSFNLLDIWAVTMAGAFFATAIATGGVCLRDEAENERQPQEIPPYTVQ